MAKNANTERNDRNFKVGDGVMLLTMSLKLKSGSNTRELFSKYYGQFKILRQVSPFWFKIEPSHTIVAIETHDTFHTSLLQPCKADKYGSEKRPRPALVLKMAARNMKMIKFLTDRREKVKYSTKLSLRAILTSKTWEPDKSSRISKTRSNFSRRRDDSYLRGRDINDHISSHRTVYCFHP